MIHNWIFIWTLTYNTIAVFGKVTPLRIYLLKPNGFSPMVIVPPVETCSNINYSNLIYETFSILSPWMIWPLQRCPDRANGKTQQRVWGMHFTNADAKQKLHVASRRNAMQPALKMPQLYTIHRRANITSDNY